MPKEPIDFAQGVIRASLEKDLKECHDAALRFIERVTNYAQDQADSEGATLDPYIITAEKVVEYAAKHIGADYDELYQNYVDLMVLEKMIEFVQAQ